MPIEIVLPQLPAGIVVHVGAPGEPIGVNVRAFASTEDGETFLRYVDFLTQPLRLAFPHVPHRESSVDHVLIIIRRDRTAILYADELKMRGRVLVKKIGTMHAGDAIYMDDIADVSEFEIEGVDIPPDCGLIFLFSVGWQKGVFFDFGPLGGVHREDRDYSLSQLFAQYYSYLAFRELFKITEDEWDIFVRQQWFPFASLKRDTINNMVNNVRAGKPIDDLLEQIRAEVVDRLPDSEARWTKNAFTRAHALIFQRAAERFIASDYMSATSLLYPRIEGVIRGYMKILNPSVSASQKNLATFVSEDLEGRQHPYSLLMPKQFKRYLEEVYFAHFNPADPQVTLSRNTISHGVAQPEDFNAKAACIGFLIIEQLLYQMREIDRA